MQVRAFIVILCMWASAAGSTPANTEGDYEAQANRERRSASFLGDLTADAPGVLNENYVPLENCRTLYEYGHTDSGVYTIRPRDGRCPFNVFCDMELTVSTDRKGWLVIQRRVSASVDFARGRDDYQYGFGQLDGDFWLGLENIKRLTDRAANGYQLHAAYEDDLGDIQCALWDKFSLGSRATDWKLSISTGDLTTDDFGCSSCSTNFLASFDGKKFSAECAGGGGWWYNNCGSEATINDAYVGTTGIDTNGQWVSAQRKVKKIVLAIRPH